MAGRRRWRASRNFSKNLVIACPKPYGKRVRPWHADSNSQPTIALSHLGGGERRGSCRQPAASTPANPCTAAYHWARPRLTTSTRRFFARPSGVLFGVIGLVEP